MITLTHNQLILLYEFINTIKKEELKYPQNDQLQSFREATASNIVRSNMVYALTLNYPTTQIDDDLIHWIIKNSLPTKEQLNKFHGKLNNES